METTQFSKVNDTAIYPYLPSELIPVIELFEASERESSGKYLAAAIKDAKGGEFLKLRQVLGVLRSLGKHEVIYALKELTYFMDIVNTETRKDDVNYQEVTNLLGQYSRKEIDWGSALDIEALIVKNSDIYNSLQGEDRKELMSRGQAFFKSLMNSKRATENDILNLKEVLIKSCIYWKELESTIWFIGGLTSKTRDYRPEDLLSQINVAKVAVAKYMRNFKIPDKTTDNEAIKALAVEFGINRYKADKSITSALSDSFKNKVFDLLTRFPTDEMRTILNDLLSS